MPMASATGGGSRRSWFARPPLFIDVVVVAKAENFATPLCGGTKFNSATGMHASITIQSVQLGTKVASGGDELLEDNELA